MGVVTPLVGVGVVPEGSVVVGVQPVTPVQSYELLANLS